MPKSRTEIGAFWEAVGAVKGFDRNTDGVMEVVEPATYSKGIRQKKRKISFKRSGRPRIVEAA